MRPRLAFIPTPSGPLHLGSISTYFAGWLLARKCGWDIVVIPDPTEADAVEPDDFGDWLDAVEDLFRTLAIEPDHIYTFAELAPLWKECADYDRSLCYLCRCPLTMRDHPHDPCQDDQHPIPEHHLVDGGFGGRLYVRAKATAQAIGYCGANKIDPTAHAAKMWHHMGIGAFIRGRDLVDEAGRRERVERGLGLRLIPTYWAPKIVTDASGAKLCKRAGAPAMTTLLATELSSDSPLAVLRGLWDILQSGIPAPGTMEGMIYRFRASRLNEANDVPSQQFPPTVWQYSNRRHA